MFMQMMLYWCCSEWLLKYKSL